MLMQDGGNMLSAPDQNETVEFGADLSSVLSPSLRAFADVWQKSRTGDGFPSRQDLNPAEFPRLLPHLYIMDRDQPPVHWRYRLAGAEIHQSLQQVSLKGRGLNEVLPENALPLVSRRWSPVADAGSGVYMSGPIYRDADSLRVGARLLLPLSDSRDRTTTGLVGVSMQDRQSQRISGEEPLRIAHIDL
jgi:hypothetical protein